MAISSDNSFNQSKEQERIRDILQLKQTALKRLENDMDKQINNLIQRKTKMENKIDENASKKIQVFREGIKSRLLEGITDFENDIKVLTEAKDKNKDIEKLKKEIKDYTEELKDYTAGRCWGNYPTDINETVVEKYTTLFQTLTYPICKEVPYINIMMIGETGAGKSSFWNTFSTAIEKTPFIKDICNTYPEKIGDQSITRKMHLRALFLHEKQLPIRFYDLPGISTGGCVGKDELEMAIDGKLMANVEIQQASLMKRNGRFLRQNPSAAYKIHCILYVVKATSNFMIDESQSLTLMRQIRRSKKEEDDVRQFAIITKIDQCGVPNDDMAKAYTYGCVEKLCKQVAGVLELDVSHVIPVSNYFDEAQISPAKNGMSLMALWRVCCSAKDYVLRRWDTNPTNGDF